MTIDELLDTIMEEPVEACRDNYDAVSTGKPFGLRTMVESDRQLWLDESLSQFFKRRDAEKVVERQDLEDNDEI